MSRSFYVLLPSNRLPDAPKVGQRVRIEGQQGLYLVLRLDTKRFAADLMLMTGNHEIEHGVPFFAIDPVEPKERAASRTGDEPEEAESEAAAR